jgi:hypothetical protein
VEAHSEMSVLRGQSHSLLRFFYHLSLKKKKKERKSL